MHGSAASAGSAGSVGAEIHALARELWPIPRSITGPGLRETLAILQREMPEMTIHDVPTGTQCFDWTVPREWTIRDAWVEAPDGSRIADFRKNNLHVVGYSVPVDAELDLEELQSHLHSLPDQPDAIPYVTSYYQERWGFCITENARRALKPGRYRVRIDSDLSSGFLTYGEVLLPGSTDREIFLSTYVCHPSMANNELSGPCVTTHLVKWLRGLEGRKHGVRVVFIPETIGSICYISRNLDTLRERVAAGFVVTCVGDDRAYSHVPSRKGDTVADRAARHVLHHTDPGYRQYTYLDRGGDERQYCSPGVDLPVALIMRSKYGTFPEYHTSLDDLDFVTPSGLEGAYMALRRAIEAIEKNRTPRATVLCEPQLGKRGLYPNLSATGSAVDYRKVIDLLAYADGTRDLIEIADTIGVPFWDVEPLCATLEQHGLLQSA